MALSFEPPDHGDDSDNFGIPQNPGYGDSWSGFQFTYSMAVRQALLQFTDGQTLVPSDDPFDPVAYNLRQYFDSIFNALSDDFPGLIVAQSDLSRQGDSVYLTVCISDTEGKFILPDRAMLGGQGVPKAACRLSGPVSITFKSDSNYQASLLAIFLSQEGLESLMLEGGLLEPEGPYAIESWLARDIEAQAIKELVAGGVVRSANVGRVRLIRLAPEVAYADGVGAVLRLTLQESLMRESSRGALDLPGDSISHEFNVFIKPNSRDGLLEYAFLGLSMQELEQRQQMGMDQAA